MKKTKGISLIVLVITIIVMIIIAGAIILSLTQTNVIDQAEVAADKYNLSQLKEAVNLDRTNALLTRYNTTEGVNISVKELLGLTDSDAMEITSTNTMPGNMPAGKYYKLDVTKYGMQSAGTVENNTIKGVYVINDNYDIYYVVEGITSEVAQDIDDEKVAEILMDGLIYETKDEVTMVTELKQELDIKDVEGNKITDIAFNFSEPPTGENGCIYFYTIDRLYLFNSSNMQIEYVSKEENKVIYQYAAKLEQIRQELEVAFVGEMVTDIKDKYDTNTLEQYILNNCSSIKAVQFCEDWDEDWFIMSVNFEYGNYGEAEFQDTIRLFIDSNGKYSGITIMAGN